MTEEIILNGQKVRTLKELLRGGLKAVFVGINPAPLSVERGHYYQGRLGQRFWNRLREYGIAPVLPDGTEDDVAFDDYDYGFSDLIRRPTASSKDLSKDEMSAAVPDLEVRLSKLGDLPIIVFVFERAREFAGPHLERKGYRVLRMPGPYAKKEDEKKVMNELKKALSESSNPPVPATSRH